jgi:hypothetical protein
MHNMLGSTQHERLYGDFFMHETLQKKEFCSTKGLFSCNTKSLFSYSAKS